MNARLICFCVLLISSFQSFSQENQSTEVTNVTKANFLSPGVSVERKVGKLQTISLQAYMSTSAYFFYSSSLGTDAGISFDPALSAQYRYYYNAAKRQEKGKRTEMNSMNYVGAVWETLFSKDAVTDSGIEQENRRPVNSIGIVWGLQRNYQKRFSLDLNLGAGYMFAKETEFDEGRYITSTKSMITPLGQLSLGFWLNKGK
ncbi:DUF3575 domain-containing protein [Chitinophagaceae bacterium LB-8]|jgi:uncharacterized protein DUF3575|uniref:DUF3575 domain-containing protein n=1 Tax=Paraflavisolibacter caeni TaxID=2982496 RepID=A0A9X2XPL3_9BACT|nr:DUF3575 domain-containing protein [Paraflavisolibacter caeni]MCU7551189.1 DUF3575 domain-containing protein [Paraflavisolibacter caeni]